MTEQAEYGTMSETETTPAVQSMNETIVAMMQDMAEAVRPMTEAMNDLQISVGEPQSDRTSAYEDGETWDAEFATDR
jgi:hypothetical protein